MRGYFKRSVAYVFLVVSLFVCKEAFAEEFMARYRSGDAPLTAKSRVTISFSDNTLTIRSIDYDNEAFILPLKSIRGITGDQRGCWLYWFDASGNTVHAFFKSKQGCPVAQAVNQAIQQYHADQVVGEEYKERFLQYQREALENAK